MDKKSNINYSIEEIANILDLDESDYDLAQEVNENNLLEIIEPLYITKVMQYNDDYNEAINYIFNIFEKVCNKESKYVKYRSVIFELSGGFLNGDYNIDYRTAYFNNLNHKKAVYSVNYFKNLNEKLNDYLKTLDSFLTKEQKFNFVKLTTKCSKGNKYETELNIYSLLKCGDNFDINDKDYYDIFDNFLTKSSVKYKFLEFIEDVLEKNKKCGYNNAYGLMTNDYKNLASTRYLALVLKINLILFDKCDKSKIFLNNNKLIFNETERKDFEINKDYTDETRIYMISLNSLKLFHNYIVINYLDLSNSNSLFSQLINMNNQAVNKKFEIVKNIVLSTELNKYIEKLLDYYTTEFLQINNDAIDTVIQYYFNMMKINKNYLMIDNIITYFCKLLSTKSEYCNKHYKFDVLNILCNVINKKPIDYFKNNLNLMKSLINYYEENDMFKIQDLSIAHKYFKESLEILRKIIDNSEINEGYNNDLFLKFVYKMNSHNLSFLDFLDQIFKELSKSVNDFTTKMLREKYKPMITSIVTNIILSMDTVYKLLNKKILNPTIFRGEIILPIITLATDILKYFTNGKNLIYSVFNMNFEALEIMQKSICILHQLTVNGEFTELIKWI